MTDHDLTMKLSFPLMLIVVAYISLCEPTVPYLTKPTDFNGT